MKIAVIFDKLVTGTTGIYCILALRKLGHEVDHFWLRDAEQIPTHYDLYFRVDHGFYNRDLPRHLKPSVYWALDIHHEHSFKAVTQMYRGYDFLFGCHQQEVEKLRQSGVPIQWIPVACDPEIHSKKEGDIRYDIAFVGGDNGIPRKFILQELRERYPNSFMGETLFNQMADVYSLAKIGFNYSIRSDINMRFFEVMACGAMLLTNTLPRKDLDSLDLIPGRDFIEYRNFEELFSLVEYYLYHDQERGRIAESGHCKVIKEHTYLERVEQMLAKIRGQIPASPGCSHL